MREVRDSWRLKLAGLCISIHKASRESFAGEREGENEKERMIIKRSLGEEGKMVDKG